MLVYARVVVFREDGGSFFGFGLWLRGLGYVFCLFDQFTVFFSLLYYLFAEEFDLFFIIRINGLRCKNLVALLDDFFHAFFGFTSICLCFCMLDVVLVF